jgi:hypothetical protein
MAHRLLKCWVCCAVVSYALIFSSGCKEKAHEKEADPIKSLLTARLNNPFILEDDKERTRTTLAKYENKTLGAEPVLLQALITRAQGNERPDMSLLIVDQNEDVIGVGIREDCNDSNCCWKTIEETYPAYIHFMRADKVHISSIPLHIRNNCQKKDESAWAEYINLDYYKLGKDYIRQNLYKYSFKLNDKTFYSVPDAATAFRESVLPPVWVSKPEPNKLDVWVWVFDKAGNKSEPIKLINHVDWTNKVEPITEVRTIPADNDANKYPASLRNNTPKVKKPIIDKSHRRLENIKFDEKLAIGKVHAIWGEPDVIEDSGLINAIYKLEDGRKLRLLFNTDLGKPHTLLNAEIFEDFNDTQGKVIFKAK